MAMSQFWGITSTLSMIPPKVLMIQDVRCCYTWKIREVGDMEIWDAYSKLCDNRVLREDQMGWIFSKPDSW